MKAICNEKQYKKNRLSNRIRGTMTFGNTISTLILLVLMALVIGSLVGFLGRGFSSYISTKMADDVSRAYIETVNNSEFTEALKKINHSYGVVNGAEVFDGVVDEETLYSFKEELVENGQLDQLHKLDLEGNADNYIKYFDYTITYKDVLVYDSMMVSGTTSKFDEFTKDNLIADKLFSTMSSVIMDETGEEIGLVTVGLSTDVIQVTFMISVTLAFAILIINIIVNRIVSTATSKMVSRPLESLADQMDLMAKEELEDAFNTEFNIKRPVSEVTSLIGSTELIMRKMSEYYETMMAQNQEMEAQRDVLANQKDELEAQKDELEAQRDELEAQNEELAVSGENLQSMNNAYLSRTLKLQNLMDNIGQGFMTFGEDLKVNGEFSDVCMLMLCDNNGDIQGRSVTDLLFEDQEEREFIESILKKIIKGTEKERKLFIPLLPDELNNNGRVQHVEYKIVKDEVFREQMMVILTDITETRDLEKQMSQKKDTLQMIVKVLLNRDEFMTLINGFKSFVATLNEPSKLSDYEATLRTIHTYKGTFAQYYMTTVSGLLNDLEDAIYKSENFDVLTHEAIEALLEGLEEDLNSIEGYVGEEFMEANNTYTIKSDKLDQVEESLQELLTSYDFNKVLPLIKSLRYKSVKSTLNDYPEYVVRLASRLDKSVAPFAIEGDDVYVDFEVYQPILKSLVHIFRNSVDHGIETMDARVMANKNETANIHCRVNQINEGAFEVIIKDDGAGIDVLSLKEKALSAGFITEEQEEKMTNEEALNLIFNQGLSTKERSTTLSGRGVGLAAVKALIDGVGGHIQVTSVLGEGTSFVVTLPIIKAENNVHIDSVDFMKRIDQVATNNINAMGLDIRTATVAMSDGVTLNRHSTVLNIKGSLDGLLIVSANKSAMRHMVKSFMVGDVQGDEMAIYAGPVLGELANTVLGNVLAALETLGVYITIGVPVMMSNKKTAIKYAENLVHSLHYDYEGNIVDIHLLLTDSHSKVL